jgi:hypothetical protein
MDVKKEFPSTNMDMENNPGNHKFIVPAVCEFSTELQ